MRNVAYILMVANAVDQNRNQIQSIGTLKGTFCGTMGFISRFLVLLLITGSSNSFRLRRLESDCPEVLPDGCHCEGSSRRTRLVCSGSGLTEVPELTFGQTENLYMLDVSRNQITGVVNFDLQIKRIRKLFLGHNGISRIVTPSYNRDHWATNHMDLSYNRLTAVPELITDMDDLATLDLSYNDITILTWTRFSGLIRLRKLYIEGNPISSLLGTPSLSNIVVLFTSLPEGQPISELPQMNRLRTLHIQGSKISFADSDNWFTFSPYLRHLTYRADVTLADDDVTSIPTQVLGSQLTYISLVNNSLPGGKTFWNWLGNFASLHELDLSFNDITGYDVNVFREMPHLERLNLEGNRPFSISSGMFTDLSNLGELNIRNNGLMYLNLNPHLSRIPPNLIVRLADNQWHCGCKLHWLKQLIQRQLAGESWNLETHEILHEISCSHPERLRGQLIKDISSDEMTC